MALMLVAPLALAAAALTPAEARAVEAAVAEIYAPYRQSGQSTAAWDQPVWSAEINRLVAEWKTVMPEGEVDDLNGGDWLCLCQDWDPKAFSATVTAVRPQQRGVAMVAVRIRLGAGPGRDARLVMRREGGRWLADDLFARDFPKGLKQALRQTIAADRKLRK